MKAAARHRARSPSPPKKIRKREKRTIFTPLLLLLNKRKYGILAGTFIALGIVLLFVVLKKTIRSSAYTITDITFSQESLAQYDDPTVYQYIVDTLRTKNYFALKRFTLEETVTDLQKEFPLIKAIRIQQQAPQTFIIDIEFHQPKLVFSVPDGRQFASYQEQLYSLASGNTLWNKSIHLELPRFTAELRTLDGIYYQIAEEELVNAMTIVLSTLWENNIGERIYLPWWHQLFISYKGKRVYLHLQKDLNDQLAKLIDLENYYEGFQRLSIIDVGSTDDVIVQ